MPQTKLDPDALHHYLAAGHTQADAATYFGVSESAISQRVKKLQIATSKVVALERAGDVVDQKIDATDAPSWKLRGSMASSSRMYSLSPTR